MYAKRERLSFFAFARRFPDDDACLQFLSEWKWGDGFSCKKCNHKNYCQGRKKWNRQCTSCKYEESPTAGTLFHGIKFSLRTAFLIVFCVATMKKSMSSPEMSRKLNLRQKTCWLFRHKVMLAMASGREEGKLGGWIDLLPVCFRGAVLRRDRLREGKEGTRVRGKSSKQVVLAIERSKHGVCRVRALQLRRRSKQHIRQFMREHIAEGASIRTSCWNGVPERVDSYQIQRRPQRQKGFYYVKRTMRAIEDWLKGVHGGVTLLQSYLDEYCYRLNHREKGRDIVDDLLGRMMAHPPCPYKELRQLGRAV